MKRNHFFNVMAVCAALSFVACSGQKETSEQVEGRNCSTCENC